MNFIILARVFKSEDETQLSDGSYQQNSNQLQSGFRQQSNRVSSMKKYSS